jgi:SAM-dependent methyltransferase
VVDRAEPPDGVETRPGYVLGHAEAELRRLAFQAALVEPVTRQLLLDAGIGPGMRVLDVGTGRGDVAFLVAEVVGPRGSVVGVDRAAGAIAVARERAASGSYTNVSFEQRDPVADAMTSTFDAIVGRYVLQFQAEPTRLLRRLAEQLRPGGILALHEIDWTGHRSVPPVAIWDKCCRLVTQVLESGGAELHCGGKLPSLFAAAGLPAPSMRMTTLVGAAARSEDVVTRMSNLVLSLLPEIYARDLADQDEINGATLRQEIAHAVQANASFVAAGSEVTAWTRLTA